MLAFAERTHITSSAGNRHRYLWTDAFAVCNYLALHRATGSPEHLALARELVSRVHDGLGRHRDDDLRRGWISGLSEPEASLHPTRGGLRIGKPLPERLPDEPMDERLEWDRDGQYFHYLTRWMHALARMSQVTGAPRYLDWALELAAAAHRGFFRVDPRDGSRRICWKMSIDLGRPLVASMGQHDPLDALLTCLELRAAAGSMDGPTAGMLAEAAAIAATMDLRTVDPLGLGGLLSGAYALAQLMARGQDGAQCPLTRLLAAAVAGIEWLRRSFPAGPAQQRLAFRELGLALGLRAVPRLAALATRQWAALGGATVARQLDELHHHQPLGRAIEQFWLDPRHRTAPSWTGHRDINEVMLATCLVPDGYLEV